jgi:S-adenosylmethionine decarboxylase
MVAMQKTKYAGDHLIVEFWGAKIIEDIKKIKDILVRTAKISRNTSLGVKIHKFSPQGVTGFILLAESHISIHTWPERDYIAIDIFSCGRNSQPYKGLEYLKKEFQPKRIKIQEIRRGF